MKLKFKLSADCTCIFILAEIEHVFETYSCTFANKLSCMSDDVYICKHAIKNS